MDGSRAALVEDFSNDTGYTFFVKIPGKKKLFCVITVLIRSLSFSVNEKLHKLGNAATIFVFYHFPKISATETSNNVFDAL